MRLDGLVVLTELTDRFEADVLIAALKAGGIPATIAEDSRRSMLGGGLLGPGTHGADPVVEVLVPAARLGEARAVLEVTTVGDAVLPPEFRDEAWDEHVGTRRHRRRNLRRRWVLFWIYALFAVIVVILLVGVVSSLLH
jgi:hypothetical protein